MTLYIATNHIYTIMNRHDFELSVGILVNWPIFTHNMIQGEIFISKMNSKYTMRSQFTS